MKSLYITSQWDLELINLFDYIFFWLQDKVGILPLWSMFMKLLTFYWIYQTSIWQIQYLWLNFVDFTTVATRSTGMKLYPKMASSSYIMNSSFYCLPLLWKSIPVIELSKSVDVIKSLLANFGNNPSFSLHVSLCLLWSDFCSKQL